MEELRPGFQLAVRLGKIEIALFAVALTVKLALSPLWFSWWMVCMPLWIPILGSFIVAFYYRLRRKNNPFVPNDMDDLKK